ncbi:hypothetical protein PFISCL1PPCAC_15315, partial [Pristionchus fissidentatus]
FPTPYFAFKMLEFLLQIFTFCTLIASMFFNFLLFILINRNGSRIGNYRHFFVCSIIFDLAYSLSEWIVSPFYYTTRGVCVVAAASPFCTKQPLIEILWCLWMKLYMDIIIIVAHSFIYRYAIVSRSFLLALYENPIYAAIVTLISFV